MQQVSVFAENQRGMMEKITGVLRSEDINILGSVTNDSANTVSSAWSYPIRQQP